MTQLDLITRRYDNALLALPTLKKHQRRRYIDGIIINSSDPEPVDNWTSLGNELQHWTRALGKEEDEETKIYCGSRLNRIKNQIRKRVYEPEHLSGRSKE